ncbi:hypothetical protein PQR63_00240 [Herbaspirillum rhizosphaerae]|uniref:Uncharacterized protein n=1 Tax=Herbaspirillum rhizosphaerae TaxID=346179 RepID=A0ABW8Z398_9BURK
MGVLVATSLTFNTTGFSILSFNPALASLFAALVATSARALLPPALMPDLVAFESTSLAADGTAFLGVLSIASPALFPVPGFADAGAVFLTVRDFTTTTLPVDEVVFFFGATAVFAAVTVLFWVLLPAGDALPVAARVSVFFTGVAALLAIFGSALATVFGVATADLAADLAAAGPTTATLLAPEVLFLTVFFAMTPIDFPLPVTRSAVDQLPSPARNAYKCKTNTVYTRT